MVSMVQKTQTQQKRIKTQKRKKKDDFNEKTNQNESKKLVPLATDRHTAKRRRS